MKRLLILIDGIVNLLLGALLLLFPTGLIQSLGLPPVLNHFYTTILGGVIFALGSALAIEWFRPAGKARGLDLARAIAINLCGGGVLLWWLVFEPMNLPERGQVTLYVVAIIVLGIGLAELFSGAWKKD